MVMRVFDVVNGQPVADLAALDAAACLARKRVVEGRMGDLRRLSETHGILRGSPEFAEREALKNENAAIDARLRDLKEASKRETSRRVFAGIGSPLHEAIAERLAADVVAELEAVAMRKLQERERRNAERKAAKQG